MAFNTVGIQSNEPVLPIHVLQIIESLTFSGTYAAEPFYRQGRTNFGASSFGSSAHVEMHSYGGADPLVIFSGPGDNTQVLRVDSTGGTVITALTASGAAITTGSIGRAGLTTAFITEETVASSTITTATIGTATIQSGIVSTLNATVGAIATFTASNAQIADEVVTTAVITNLTSPSANLTGSLLGTASYATQGLSASYTISASHANTALTASFITGSNVVGTVVSASYALTASYALNAGGAQISGYVTTSSFNSYTGSNTSQFAGTASHVNIIQGPGITVNGMAVTASVRTVNGINPVNGNITVSLSGVLTGLSSSNYDVNLVASSSGAITSSFSNGILWVVSGETGSTTSGSNGRVFIYKSASVGQWLRVAPLDTAAADARYFMLNGSNSPTANINFGGFGVTNAGTWQGIASTASFATGSIFTNTNPALSASYALTSSFAVSASWAPTPGLNAAVLINTGSISTTQGISGSLQLTGSLGVTGSVVVAGAQSNRFVLAGSVRSSYIYPTSYAIPWFTNDGVNLNLPTFPYLEGVFQGGQVQSGVNTIYGHLKIGSEYFDDTDPAEYLRAVTIWRDNVNSGTPSIPTLYPKPVYRTIITDNSTVLEIPNLNTAAASLVTANERKHVFAVTGSMLARDSVSIGTNIQNSHIITGSVNMTGSFVLNGTDVNSILTAQIQTAVVNLSAAQILTLGTSPVELVPSPGINRAIVVSDLVQYYKYITAYAGPGLSSISFSVGNQILAATSILNPANTSDLIVTARLPNATFNASAISNQPLRVATSNGQNLTSGTSTLQISITYQIIDLI